MPDNKNVFIKQGQTGDLYAIFQSDYPVILLSATFTLYAEDSVTVVLAANPATVTITGPATAVRADYSLDTSTLSIAPYDAVFTLNTDAGAQIFKIRVSVVASVPSPPITVGDVKDVLVGLEDWFEAAALCKSRYDDTKIQTKITEYIRKFERECQYRINQVQVCCDPDGQYAPVNSVSGITLDTATGTMPVFVDAPYPYFAEDAAAYFQCVLRHRPVQSVQRLRIMLDRFTVAYQVPPEWFRFEPHSGVFNLQATSGTALAGASLGTFSVLQTSLEGANGGVIPQSLAFDYVVGLPPGWQDADEYSDIKSVVCEYIAWKVLNDISHIYDAGLMSVSLNDGMGMSQTLNYGRFNDRKKELAENVAAFQQVIKDQETPILFGTL